MFSLPVDFVTDITANSTSAIGALAPYITLIIGVLLAVLVISILIRAIK